MAIRGGYKAARNGAISCAILLAVIEGVGIGFQKMFAGATKLEVSRRKSVTVQRTNNTFEGTATTSFGRKDARLERDSFGCFVAVSSTHPTLLWALDRVQMCIFVCIYDGQHIGGGVRCNIELVRYACHGASESSAQQEYLQNNNHLEAKQFTHLRL